MLSLWVQFLFVGAIVVFSGNRLTRYADALAGKTGMRRTWIGVILLASMTSLPELFTGISAVAVVNGPDIAVGDLLGSCVFNLTIIAMLDFYYRPGRILSKAEQGHIIAAGYGLVSLSVVAITLFAAEKDFEVSLLWIGLYTPVLIFLYFRGMFSIYSYEKRMAHKEIEIVAEHEKLKAMSKRRIYWGFGFHSLTIIASASFLPFIAKDLSEATGLGQTFTGLIFVALATSLPEVTTSLAAVRIGALDLAVGNLLGSNMFNLLILAVDDLLFFRGSLLANVSSAHQSSALAAILMSGIAILALFYRPEPRGFGLRLSWLATVIFSIYILNAVFVYFVEHT
jgi:cation:H+ antiporter